MANVRRSIAFFLPNLGGGGAERVFLTLANQLADHGLPIDLVLMRHEGSYIEMASPSVNIVSLNCSLTAAPFALARYLKAATPTILFSAMELYNVIAAISCQISKSDTALVVTCHLNFSAHCMNSRRPVLNRILGLMLPYAYRRAERIVAVSQGVANDIAVRMGSQNSLTIIPNPVEIQFPDSETYPHEWCIPTSTSPPLLLAAGRLDQQKNFELLIDAVAQISNVRLVILGEGEERLKLEEQVKRLGIGDRVLLPGFASNPFSWYVHADLFVSSARYEGFGLAIVEALGSGCPVVATNCPSGPAEILHDRAWGELVANESLESLIWGIRSALSRSFSSKSLRDRAADYSVDKAVIAYQRLITEIEGDRFPTYNSLHSERGATICAE